MQAKSLVHYTARRARQAGLLYWDRDGKEGVACRQIGGTKTGISPVAHNIGAGENEPITTQLSAWYSGIGLMGLILLLALAGYGFYTSPGDQPLFGRAMIEEDR